jgi:hypothetical protein
LRTTRCRPDFRPSISSKPEGRASLCSISRAI